MKAAVFEDQCTTRVSGVANRKEGLSMGTIMSFSTNGSKSPTKAVQLLVE